MADKTYRMTVSLSDGNTVNAGTFIVPQGPVGPQGPEGPQGPAGSGGSGINFIAHGINDALEPGTYIIKIEGLFSGTVICDINDGTSKFILNQVLSFVYKDANNKITGTTFEIYYVKVENRVLKSINRVSYTTEMHGEYADTSVDGVEDVSFDMIGLTSFKAAKID